MTYRLLHRQIHMFLINFYIEGLCKYLELQILSKLSKIKYSFQYHLTPYVKQY